MCSFIALAVNALIRKNQSAANPAAPAAFFGELMAMRFSRPDSPEMSLQADLLTANSSAINAIRC